jgi:hypothetical protein
LFLEKWGKYSVPHYDSPHNILFNKQLIYSNVLMNKVLEYKEKLNKTYLTYLMYKKVIPIEAEIIAKSTHFLQYFKERRKQNKPLRFFYETLQPQDLIDMYNKRKDKCCDAKFYMLIEYLAQYPEYKNLSKKLISENIKSYRNYRSTFEFKILNFEVEDPQDFAKIFAENYSVLCYIKELVPTMNLELLYHIALLQFDFKSMHEVFATNLLAMLDVLGLAIANNNQEIINFYFQNYKSNQSVIVNYISKKYMKQ